MVVRKWIRVVTLAFALGAAFPSGATTITGLEGAFAPATDFTLPYRADGIFDFSTIDIGADITLRFDPQWQNVTLLSLGDALVAGKIDATGIRLSIETSGQFALTGTIVADSLALRADGMLLAGDVTVGPGTVGAGLCLGVAGECMPRTSLAGLPLLSHGVLLQPRGDISLVSGWRVFAVPEPATSWLLALLLPVLMLHGRKRTCGRAPDNRIQGAGFGVSFAASKRKAG